MPAGFPRTSALTRKPRSDDPPRRIARHAVARLAGASAIAVLGQFAVDMPDGHFGPRDEVAPLGWAFCILAIAAVAVETVRFLLARTSRGPSGIASLAFVLNAGVFVPALVADPIVAGGVVLWQLTALARHLLDRPSALEMSPLVRTYDPSSPPLLWLARRGRAVRHLLVVSLVAWAAVLGYGMSSHWVAWSVCFVLFLASSIPGAHFLWLVVRHERRAAALVWIPLLGAVALVGSPGPAMGLLALHQVLLLGVMVAHSKTLDEVTRHFLAQPSLFVAYTFGALIAIGTVLLTLPVASTGGRSLEPVDALFTATSAVCVTGLIVKDTPVDFTTAGHGILLALFQVGGLGMMVLSAFATVMLGGRLGLHTERALGQQFETGSTREVQRLTWFIVIATAGIELVGALALYPSFRDRGLDASTSAWHAAFHSVSAFCNAGFSLWSDSLVGFRRDPYTLAVVAALITVGGLGFSVLGVGWVRLRRRQRSPLPLQVRIVLLTSVVLVAAGAAIYLATEWDRSLAGLSATDRIVNALFQSVTLRTAGFNSVDFGVLQTATLLAMVVFMLIGASPGSTGGGMKTTTIAVLVAVIPSLGRNEANVTAFGRTIPQEVVFRAGAIVSITLAVFASGVFALALTQALPLELLLFEAASAVGTVGLSAGATPKLDAAGKLIVTALMFVGRVGPLTLALSLGQGTPRKSRYPEETVAVG